MALNIRAGMRILYKKNNSNWLVGEVGAGNIPMKDEDGITFVSGASPIIFEMVMTGKTSMNIMLDKLLSTRYEAIKSCYE